MGTPFLNDKQQTQDLKKFIQPHTQNRVTETNLPKDRKGGAGAPDNRHLPIRGNFR